jgi:transcriptional regulator with XRE-family HTH domain
LRRLRQLKALSLRDVAKSIGVSTTSVYCWEMGRMRPTAANLAKLAKVLNVAEAEIVLGGEAAGSAGGEPSAGLDIQAEKLLTLGEIIEVARGQIASFAGIGPEKVKITLEV